MAGRGRAGGEREEAAHPRADDLEPVLEGCLEALAEEIAAVREELVRRGLDAPIQAGGGALLDGAGPGFRYGWTVPTGLDIRPDDGVRIRSGQGEALAFVTAYDRRRGGLRLAVSEWLGRRPGPAELEFDPTWLLASLAERLEALFERPDRFHPETALRLLGRVYPRLGRAEARRRGVSDLNRAQREALERLLGSDVHFVWGPPGTGKTRLLGHAVAELAERGRVLVAATTNGAVDEAARRIAAALGRAEVRAGRMIRVGAEFSATGDPSLSLEAVLQRRLASGAGDVVQALEGLEDRLLRGYAGLDALAGNGRPAEGTDGATEAGARERHARLVSAARAAGDEEAVRALDRVGAEMQKQAALALRDADVVLATLAALAAREELAAQRFESAVIDEASTAPLPHVVWAASLASRRAVAIGDFQQLPAVVVSRGPAASRWLGRDAFREAGVVEDAASGELPLPAEHDRLCAMLVEQYRMAPPVRALVSDLFYGGRLRDAPEVRDRAGAPHPLVLLETTPLGPTVERSEGSRANEAHADAVAGLLEVAAASGVDDVAVVVPYRLQARRLWRRVRGSLGRAAPRGLEISTIHRFQGREKSVVVFDTVDAPPARSWFLHEGRNRDLPRLLNVALSRTRDMLVVVGTSEGLAASLPEEALLNRLVRRVRDDGAVLDARRIAAVGQRLFRGDRPVHSGGGRSGEF